MWTERAWLRADRSYSGAGAYGRGMAYRTGARRDPCLALNAVRVAIPAGDIPAAPVPYDREALHAFLDRASHDVHAHRMGDEMAVVPLKPEAVLPAPRQALKAAEHPHLVAALAREAVMREVMTRSYRVIRRRPLIVEAGRPGSENVLPEGLGLPDWLKKRLV